MIAKVASKIKSPSAGSIMVAPMMDWTDRHCRFFHRLIAPSAGLYTEMVSTGALVHGDAARHLRFSAAEHLVALQLGGSDVDELAKATAIGVERGYDEINLNCGCPSERVQENAFGAVLMARPDHVAACFQSMQKAAGSIPVTIKCRIAIDDEEEAPFLDRFVRTLSKAGCHTFIIHARKAWLSGLSPKENRDIPPLRYDIVKDVKRRYPSLRIILNGGIKTKAEALAHLEDVDGVMVGREAYQNPFMLSGFSDIPCDRATLARAMIPYMEDQKTRYGTPYKTVTRHMIGLYSGVRGARAWRQTLTLESGEAQSAEKLIESALSGVEKACNSDQASRGDTKFAAMSSHLVF